MKLALAKVLSHRTQILVLDAAAKALNGKERLKSPKYRHKWLVHSYDNNPDTVPPEIMTPWITDADGGLHDVDSALDLLAV